MIHLVVFTINIVSIVAWLQANQTLVILAWPTITALASLAYTQLDKNTRIHAFLSVLASAGIDLPKLWEALTRLVVGGQPPSAGGGTTSGVGHGGIAAACLVLMLTPLGCNKPIVVPPNTPADVENALACVAQAVVVGQPVDPCVVQYGPVLVADALEILLDSEQFQNEHPEAIAFVKQQLHTTLTKVPR